LFVTGFSLGIAWFKDIPDTRGDALHAFGTLAVLQGRRMALLLGTSVIGAAYLLVIAAAVLGMLPSPAFFIASHSLVLLFFLAFAFRLNVHDDRQVKRFYRTVWAAFSLEYVLYPMGSLLA